MWGLQGPARPPPLGQTHYSILLVSQIIPEDMSRVARSRAVHKGMAGEFGDVGNRWVMHALTLALRAPRNTRRCRGRWTDRGALLDPGTG